MRIETLPPRSVANLHIQAQISHVPEGTALELLKALRSPETDADRRIAAQALQEAEIAEMVDLLVDKVLTGRAMHELLATLHGSGHIRRPDLVQWSERFA